MITVSLKSVTNANISKGFLKNEKSPEHFSPQTCTLDSPSDEQRCSGICITQTSNMVEKIEDVF